jgi:nucleoside phosphorylase
VRASSNRFRQVHFVCNSAGIWKDSERVISVFREEAAVSMLQLLDERAIPGETPILTKKQKKLVAVNLAKSLFSLLGSQWLQQFWDAERIFFLPTTNAIEAADLEFPQISCTLSSGNGNDSHVSTIGGFYPFVLSFGLLLLELELDQKVQITANDEYEADEVCPASFIALLRTFTLRKDDIDDPYLLQIINSCFDFASRVEAIDHPLLDEELRVRAAILRYILQPLAHRLGVAHQTAPSDIWNATENVLGKPHLSDMCADKVGRGRSSARHKHLAKGVHSSEPIKSDFMSSTHSPKRRLAPCSTKHQSMPDAGIKGASSSSNFQSALSSREARHGQDDSNWKTMPLHPPTRPQRPKDRGDFCIVIICALPLEADAVKRIFNIRWDVHGDPFGKAPGDRNAYSTGVVGKHNVVLAHMPGMGNHSAAMVASNCRFSFQNINLALVVGICGGVPFPRKREEILLGDIVISEGIVAYDFARWYPDGISRKHTVRDNLARPNPEIRGILAKMQSQGERTDLQQKIAEHLAAIREGEGGEIAVYPGQHEDQLFTPTYRHKHQDSAVCKMCAASDSQHQSVCQEALESNCNELKCDTRQLLPRRRLSKVDSPTQAGQELAHNPMVHFGLVASGNMVMKSGEDRDNIAMKEDVIAFEMEGAGVWDNFPCLIIKSVCDYADSHKSKKWQRYAAATAAAGMKAFLESWPARTTEG